jgi:hypothetical protein
VGFGGIAGEYGACTVEKGPEGARKIIADFLLPSVLDFSVRESVTFLVMPGQTWQVLSENNCVDLNYTYDFL